MVFRRSRLTACYLCFFVVHVVFYIQNKSHLTFWVRRMFRGQRTVVRYGNERTANKRNGCYSNHVFLKRMRFVALGKPEPSSVLVLPNKTADILLTFSLPLSLLFLWLKNAGLAKNVIKTNLWMVKNNTENSRDK